MILQIRWWIALPLVMLLGPGVSTIALAQSDSDQQTTYQGVSVGFTEEGYPFIGKADATVTLEEWSDYLCPFCGRHFRNTVPTLMHQYVRSGKLKLVFRDFPIASLHPTAARGHEAALCAGEHGAATYWAMHDALFERQNEWNRLPDPGDFLAGVAKDVGADAAAWEACMTGGDKMALVTKSVEQGQALGYSGTPSFRFRSVKSEKSYDLVGAHPLARFARLADPLIAGEAPPEAPKPKPPELPQWAKPEGLAPDPQRPGYNMAGDAYKGSPEAALVVVEFTDFQCPACRRHALETQPRVDEELVDSGEMLWVTKHFPLRIHEHAAVAAAAAACAGDQGQFWAMHHELFEKSEEWANPEAEKALVSLAEALALDMPRFLDCFNSRRGLELVLKDLYDAQGVARSTPTFIMISEGRGTVMRRSLPADQFVGLLSGRLKAIETAQSDTKARTAGTANVSSE